LEPGDSLACSQKTSTGPCPEVHGPSPRSRTNSTEPSIFWEAASRSNTQEDPSILLSTKVHYLVDNSSPVVTLLARWIQSTSTCPIYLRSILILPFCLSLGLLSRFISSGFHSKTLYAFLLCPMLATFPAHLILSDLIILILSFEPPYYDIKLRLL
jgi:hypothetical protein